MRSIIISLFVLSGLLIPAFAAEATPIPRFAYVANSGSNSVSTYTINQATGALTAGTPVAAGSGPRSVAVDPSGRFAYVVNYVSNTVSVYTINQSTGALTAGTTAPAGTEPRSVAVDPSGRFAYVANNSNTVWAYTINQATGALTYGTAVALGSQPIQPISVTVDPSGRFAYVANSASNNVSTYTINQSTGALTAGTAVAAGSAPSSVTVDPSGKFAYVANSGSNTVSTYTINQTTGALTAGTAVAAGTSPISVTVDPSGRFAYAANYGTNTVSVYTIDQTTGALTAGTAVAAGIQPFSVTVDPSGRFAYVANSASNNVSTYTIDQTTGALTAGTAVAAGSAPSSVITCAIKTNQTVSFGSVPAIAVGATGTVSATATSGLAVSFSSITPSICTISGSNVTGVSIGTCTIAANQAGNAEFNPATQVTQNIATFYKSNQTVSFGVAPPPVVGGTGTVSATATSGLAVSFTSTTPGVCTINGSTVTGMTAGTCTIAAYQAGDAYYNPSTAVAQSITVGKGSQTVNFGPAPTIGPGGTGTVSASATSGLVASFSSTTPGICTVSGSTVTGIIAGTCTIAADQAGNNNYNAANQVTQSFTIGKGSQTVTFSSTPKLFVGGNAPVSAFATSSLAVSISSTTPSVCTVSGSTVTGVAAGTCTIAADQAGDFNYNAAATVTQSIIVGTTLKVAPMVAAGSYHTVALKSDGKVAASGGNAYGELGDGTTTTRYSPVIVPGLTGVVAVAAGYYRTVALKSDGTVVAYGYNANGQLGDGTTTNRLSPVVVPALSGVVAVSVGHDHTVALKSDGTVVTWGLNTYGQLGDGTTTNRLSPVAVPGLTGVVAVSAGYSRSVALKSDGTVVAWGSNSSGELGDGTTTNRLSPVAVTGLTGIVAVSEGNSHTVALKSDGTVVGWGFNGNGELGDGTTTNRSTPVAIPGLSGVVVVSAGGSYTAVLKSNGTVVTWGSNSYGQLGDGTTTNRLSPVAVPGLTGVVAIAAGNIHTLAIKSNGTLAAWGYNGYGQFGINIPSTSSSPVAVPWGLLADQIVSFGTAPTIIMGGTGTVSASATSGLTVTFTSSTPAVCTIIGNTVTGVNAGVCTIVANQAGDANFNAAVQVTQSITIGKASQNVSFGAAPTMVYKGTGTVSASATSGLAVSFSSTTPGVCTVSGSTVTSITLGACTVAANQAGNANYLSATQVTQSITIGKANQTIGIISFSPTTVLKGGTTTASATATSGLAVSFTSATPGICTVSGSTVTGIAAGTCTVAADQAGNVNYNPASQASQSISIIPTLSGTVVDLSTGLPISTATISITGTATATTPTNASGYFAFNTPSGSYNVTISRTGYKTITIIGLILSNNSGSDIKSGLVPNTAALLNFTAAPTLPPASTGVIYSQPLTITGGNGPYTFSIANGSSLPADFTLNTAVGVISGTPTVMQSSTFSIGVTDNLGSYAEREFTVSVTSPLTISTLTLPRGMTSTDYSQAITASGGAQPYSFSLFSGALPAGLTVDSALGLLKGKITASPGTFTFAIRVMDNEGRTATQSYTLAVDPFLTQTTTRLNDAIVGTGYSQPVTATGALPPYSWSVYSGNLPAGLTLVPGTGIITGTPTTATSEPLTIAVIDSVGRSAYKAFTLRVFNPLQIPTTALPNGFVGADYSEQVRVTGGIAPYSFSISGQLPAGLTINNTTGIVSGTPTLGSFTNVSITVTDSTWPAAQTRTVTMGVRVWSQLTITSSSIFPNARTGVVITPITLAARGNTSPYNWSVIANQNGSTSYLPQGVTLDPVTGLVSGTPTDTGDFTFTIRVTDASATPITADKQFYMRVSDTLKVVTGAVPTGAVGMSYNALLSAAGGLKNYSWIVKNGTLPAGLLLNPSTGTISGTPTAKINSNVTFEAGDSDTPPQSAQKSLTFDINDTLAISENLLPNGRQGQAYLANIRPLLGTPDYTWKVSGGILPPGITLQQNAGIASLQGTPTTPGSYTFTLEVNDSSSPMQTVSRQYTIITYSPVAITSMALKNAMRGMAYSDSVIVSGGTAPYMWQIVSGNLPQGLVFNSTTGAISGITDAAIGYTASFSVLVTDGGNPSASNDQPQPYTIQAIDPLVITTSSIQSAQQYSPFSVTFAGQGGIAPHTWSLASGNLPAGITLNSASGILAGPPSACGNFPLTIQMADSSLVPATMLSEFTLVVTCNGSGPYPLTLTLLGTGTGSVNSSPNGITCTSGTCSANFTSGTKVDLYQTASQFAGWGGDCSGTGACSVTMNSGKTVTATYEKPSTAMIGSTGYTSLRLAYEAASSTVGVTTTIKLLDGDLFESLDLNLGKDILMHGGYNANFNAKSGNQTILKGPLTIRSGSLKAEGLVVK